MSEEEGVRTQLARLGAEGMAEGAGMMEARAGAPVSVGFPRNSPDSRRVHGGHGWLEVDVGS